MAWATAGKQDRARRHASPQYPYIRGLLASPWISSPGLGERQRQIKAKRHCQDFRGSRRALCHRPPGESRETSASPSSMLRAAAAAAAAAAPRLEAGGWGRRWRSRRRRHVGSEAAAVGADRASGRAERPLAWDLPLCERPGAAAAAAPWAGHPLHRQQDQPYLQGGDPLRGHPLHHRHRELYRSSRQRYAGAGLGVGSRGRALRGCAELSARDLLAPSPLHRPPWGARPLPSVRAPASRAGPGRGLPGAPRLPPSIRGLRTAAGRAGR